MRTRTLAAVCLLAAGCGLTFGARRPSNPWPPSAPYQPAAFASSDGSGDAAIPPVIDPSCTQPPSPALDSQELGKLIVVRPDAVSVGHAGGQLTASIYTNSVGQTLRGGDGALWVASHRSSDSGEQNLVLAMQRRPSADGSGQLRWCYYVAEPSGRLLRAGELEDCAGCHKAAPMDGVFTRLSPP